MISSDPPSAHHRGENKNEDDRSGQVFDIFGQRLHSFSMLDLSQKRSSASIRLLCDAAPDFGVTMAQCLDGVGVNSSELNDRDAKVTLAQEVTAIENFLRHAPKRSGLGIEIGRRYRPYVFGIWGYAILSSPTLRAGLKTSIDFANLSFIIATVGLDETRDPPLMTFDTSGLEPTVKGFILERHLTVLSNFREEITPDLPFAESNFKTTLSDPNFAVAVKKGLGLDVELNCDVDAIETPSAILDEPVPSSDPKALQYFLQQCEALTRQEHQTANVWTNKVREAAVLDLNNNPTITSVARKLAVSERTLRRRLSEEGESFRDILQDARLAIAHELLETAGLDVSTAAWRTGYAEPSSFVRAFSRRYGYPPGRIKKAQ